MQINNRKIVKKHGIFVDAMLNLNILAVYEYKIFPNASFTKYCLGLDFTYALNLTHIS